MRDKPSLVRRLFYAMFVCLHEHQRKERSDDGALWLVCDTCGNVSEAISRTKAERRQMAKRFPAVSQPKAQRVTKPNVESIRDRKAL